MIIKFGFDLKKQRGLAQIPLIIGLLIMAVAVPVATRLVEENQDTRNKAASSCEKDGDCENPLDYCNDGSCERMMNKCDQKYATYAPMVCRGNSVQGDDWVKVPGTSEGDCNYKKLSQITMNYTVDSGYCYYNEDESYCFQNDNRPVGCDCDNDSQCAGDCSNGECVALKTCDEGEMCLDSDLPPQGYHAVSGTYFGDCQIKDPLGGTAGGLVHGGRCFEPNDSSVPTLTPTPISVGGGVTCDSLEGGYCQDPCDGNDDNVSTNDCLSCCIPSTGGGAPTATPTTPVMADFPCNEYGSWCITDNDEDRSNCSNNAYGDPTPDSWCETDLCCLRDENDPPVGDSTCDDFGGFGNPADTAINVLVVGADNKRYTPNACLMGLHGAGMSLTVTPNVDGGGVWKYDGCDGDNENGGHFQVGVRTGQDTTITLVPPTGVSCSNVRWDAYPHPNPMTGSDYAMVEHESGDGCVAVFKPETNVCDNDFLKNIAFYISGTAAPSNTPTITNTPTVTPTNTSTPIPAGEACSTVGEWDAQDCRSCTSNNTWGSVCSDKGDLATDNPLQVCSCYSRCDLSADLPSECQQFVLDEPANPRKTCNNDGTATVSWNAVTGADYYSVRVNKAPLSDWDGNECDASLGNVCADVTSGSSYTFDVENGVEYQWWVHARRNNDANWKFNSDAVFGTNVICETTTVTPTNDPTKKSCNQTCSADADCQSGYCYISLMTGGKCRNSECKFETDCVCPEPGEPVESLLECNDVCATPDTPSNQIDHSVCETGYCAKVNISRYGTTMAYVCRKQACPEEETCGVCPTRTPTPTSSLVPTATSGACDPGEITPADGRGVPVSTVVMSWQGNCFSKIDIYKPVSGNNLDVGTTIKVASGTSADFSLEDGRYKYRFSGVVADMNYRWCLDNTNCRTFKTWANDGGSTVCSNECPRDFKCYKKGNDYRWAVTGYVPAGFTVTNNSECGTMPTFLGKGAGDADCDGAITLMDASLWREEYVDGEAGYVTKSNWKSDFDCDGKVGTADRSIWRPNYIMMLQGQ